MFCGFSHPKKLRFSHPKHVGKLLIRKGVLVIGGPSGSISCASAGPLTGLKEAVRDVHILYPVRDIHFTS
jgi:hypothetical protein